MRRGSFNRLYATDGVYAFSRIWNDEIVVVVLNVSEKNKNIEIVVEHLSGKDNPPEISFDLMQLAIEIVDQLTQETQLFHESPADSTLLFMRHIHRLSLKHGECSYSLARDKGRSKKNGGIKKTAADFAKCVERLVADGYGELVIGAKNLTYKATKPMPA